MTNLILGAFFISMLGPMPMVQADDFILPQPQQMIGLSPGFNPMILKGIKVYPYKPFRLDFILDRRGEKGPQVKQEATKLIKYFMASLTVSEKDLWVNLSPYEKKRIIPLAFGQTEMGRDLLAEDYILKQMTASLIYPEGKTGREFWKRIYQETADKFGTTNIPINTFNKVWIIPDKAVVYENAKAGTAFVVESRLKVMLEQDYLAISKHNIREQFKAPSKIGRIGSELVRAIIIPALTKEINEGHNFAQLRQIYNSFILASWYKNKIRHSILSVAYENKNKISGIGYASAPILGNQPQDVNYIYHRYLQAFKRGVYNYIRDDYDSNLGKIISRKYFSGGVELGNMAMTTARKLRTQEMTGAAVDYAALSVDINPAQGAVADYTDFSLSTDDLGQMLESVPRTMNDYLVSAKYPALILEKGIDHDTGHLPYPEGINVGILAWTELPGLGLSSYWADKQKTPGVNFLIIPPIGSLGFARNNPHNLYTKSAFYIKDGVMRRAVFDKPVRIDAVVTLEGNTEKLLYEQKIPSLNSPEARDMASAKNMYGSFRQEGVLVPNEIILDQETPEHDWLGMIDGLEKGSSSKGEITIKPARGSQGDWVRSFNREDKEEIISHIREVQKLGPVIVQDRIEPEEWKDDATQGLIDYNFRVLSTWHKGEVFISPEMIEVRYHEHNQEPVNVSKGSEVITLEQFFEKRGFDQVKRDRWFGKIKEAVFKATEIMEKKIGTQDLSKATGLLGWDVIMGLGEKPYMIEVNAGAVGGISTIERLLDADHKGGAVVPVMRYLAEIAQQHHLMVPSNQDEKDLDYVPTPHNVSLLFKCAYEMRDLAPVLAVRMLHYLMSKGEASSEIYYVLALALKNDGQYPQSLEVLRQAKELGFHSPEIDSLRSALELPAFGQDEAAIYEEEFNETGGFTDPGNYLDWSRALFGQGNFKKAQEVLGDALRRGSLKTKALTEIAVLDFIEILIAQGINPEEDALLSMTVAQWGHGEQTYTIENGRKVTIKAANRAMSTRSKPSLAKGGIDFSFNEAISFENNGQGIEFYVDPAMIQQYQNTSGFVPVIISIQPLRSLSKFLAI